VRQVAATLVASFGLLLAGSSAGCAEGGFDDSAYGVPRAMESVANHFGSATGGSGSAGVPDDGPPVDPGAPPEEVSCTKLAYAKCKAWATCDPVDLQRAFVDVTTCTKKLTDECKSRFDDPGNGDTPDTVKACADAIGTLDCPKFARAYFSDNGVLPSACTSKGKLGDGASCVRGSQCTSGACSVLDGKGCGSCVAPIAPGGACTDTHLCAPGTTCTMADAKCVTYAALGATCDLIAQPCNADLVCIDKKCAPRIKEGAPCTNFAHCDFGLVCNSSKGICEKWGLGKEGDTCGLTPLKGFQGCFAGAKCKITDTTSFTGSCVKAAKVGEACDFDGPVDSACEDPAVCVAGKCELREGSVCK
jgi:hypothetical protein